MVKLLQAQTFSKVLFMLSAVLFQFSIFFEGIRLLGKNRKMIIHANDFNALLGVIWLKRLFPKRVKVVYDCHELTPAVYGEWYGRIIGTFIGKLEIALIEHVDEIITVSEQEIVSAMRFLWERMKLVVEPSGAVSLAGLLRYSKNLDDASVGVIISGGNLDLSDFFGKFA